MRWNTFDKRIIVLHIYETTLLKGVGRKGAKLSNFRKEWGLLKLKAKGIVYKHHTLVDKAAYPEGMG